MFFPHALFATEIPGSRPRASGPGFLWQRFLSFCGIAFLSPAIPSSKGTFKSTKHGSRNDIEDSARTVLVIATAAGGKVDTVLGPGDGAKAQLLQRLT